jgi:hypothetical protein
MPKLTCDILGTPKILGRNSCRTIGGYQERSIPTTWPGMVRLLGASGLKIRGYGSAADRRLLLAAGSGIAGISNVKSLAYSFWENSLRIFRNWSSLRRKASTISGSKWRPRSMTILRFDSLGSTMSLYTRFEVRAS